VSFLRSVDFLARDGVPKLPKPEPEEGSEHGGDARLNPGAHTLIFAEKHCARQLKVGAL
jgi:hypothetical protein